MWSLLLISIMSRDLFKTAYRSVCHSLEGCSQALVMAGTKRRLSVFAGYSSLYSDHARKWSCLSRPLRVLVKGDTTGWRDVFTCESYRFFFFFPVIRIGFWKNYKRTVAIHLNPAEVLLRIISFQMFQENVKVLIKIQRRRHVKSFLSVTQ